MTGTKLENFDSSPIFLKDQTASDSLSDTHLCKGLLTIAVLRKKRKSVESSSRPSAVADLPVMSYPIFDVGNVKRNSCSIKKICRTVFESQKS